MRLIQLLKKELAREARGWVDESLITHEQGQADAC
ncbi:isocitrate lyase [Shewanella benthica KT99]|uniref:Isocitrate lyase n=1 Tax=Shewanella benthica KT99 TaxID=314608 RepID=A9DHQ6_9GAMM|nr:isocitrate lyase [Shewanella benthica KT99]